MGAVLGGTVALGAALLSIAVWTAPAGHAAASSAAVEPVSIRSWPIRSFRIGSSQTRFGSLEFVGGLEMTSSSRDFGGLSAFRFLEPGGRVVGVADTGFWFFGRLARDADGRPSGVADFTMQQMVDPRGQVMGDKGRTDAEGLAIRGDIATVTFERQHRVSEFRLDPAGMKSQIRNLGYVIPPHELRNNRGLETIAHAPSGGPLAGARVVVSEKSLDKAGNIFAAIIEGPGKGIFTVARRGEFDITDGAFLPNGDLLLLERSYAIARGVGMRLRRIPGKDIRKGAVADGEILLEAGMAYQIDNMEGLDVWRREDGKLMVSVISDDNHSILQRNLYLEFILHED
ncbi:MAG: esterase-like activity of phytase family protein [Mesorhizobium sp.]